VLRLPFLGGLIVIGYFWSIHYIPELSWDSVLVLLAVAAALGLFLALFSIGPLLLPTVMWQFNIQWEAFDAWIHKDGGQGGSAQRRIGSLSALPFTVAWLLTGVIWTLTDKTSPYPTPPLLVVLIRLSTVMLDLDRAHAEN
jgi:hypothetical protein